MTTEELTPQQQHFVRLLVRGESQTRAYELAYKKDKPNKTAAASAASRLMKNPAIQKHKAQLQEEADNAAIMSRREKLANLASIARDDSGDTTCGERMKAIEIDNRMQGHNEPEKSEVVHHIDMSQVISLVSKCS